MVKLDIGLRFPGTCEQAFKFYQSVFGGELFMLQRFKEMKPHGYKIEKEDEDKIAFVALKLGKKILLGGDDDSKSFPKKLIQGNNVSFGISAASKKAAERLYETLSEGGTEKNSLADVYWGEYTGSFKDKFGVLWNISYHYPKAK
jgi:PhnB protein